MPTWWSASPSTQAQAMVPRLLDLPNTPQPYAMDVDDMAQAACSMAAALGEMVSPIKAQVNGRLDWTAKVARAKFVSAYGFSAPPAPREAPAVDAATRVRVRHRVVSLDLGRAAVVVACGQHRLTSCKALAPALRALRVGSEHTASDLVQLLPADDGDAAPQLFQILRDLASFRALDAV